METNTKEKITASMDLTALMAITQIAKDTHISTDDALISFMKSNAAVMLYDDKTKLWWDGPFAVAEEYKGNINCSMGENF